ncbi:hypothetical protein WJX72_005838 [[Myrmecia] bisecta]|uniref:Sphingomyelin phosphodiesterase 4 n=1 Tax=[Myrmecia] bisecta TaxID=41462 RepID=A0AAW1Q100_9CHLO
MADRGWDTFAGLNAILEGQKLPIAKACQAVEGCLDVNRDNLRGFFEQCFSLLLKQIFGYDGSSWLTSVGKSGREADAKALVDLLSPAGKLFNAMQSADADGLIKFMFPLERLPTHTQILLGIEAGRQVLNSWPQYHNHIVTDASGRCQVHLNVFEYFMFWTAFYVLRGSHTQADYAPSRTRYGYGSFTPTSLGGSVRKTLRLTKGGQQGYLDGHPYLRLLRAYLDHFLQRPKPGSALHASRLGGSALAPKSRLGRSSSHRTEATQGELLLSVLVEFWLTDSDEALPLPAHTSPAGSQTPSPSKLFSMPSATPIRSRSYEPPSEDLLEALMVLVRYVTVLEDPNDKRSPAKSAQLLGPWLPRMAVDTAAGNPLGRTLAGATAPAGLGAAASPSAQAFSRRLYRFLSRAFASWPEQRSITPIVNLWLAFIAPWWAPPSTDLASAWRAAPSAAGAANHGGALVSHVSELVHHALGDSHSPARGQDELQARFVAREWQAHVLANLPFYSLLLPQFLELTLGRVSSHGDAALAELLKVLNVFVAAPELGDLLRTVEHDFARYMAHPARRPEGLYAEVLPFLHDQAQDWEVTALADSSGRTPPQVVPEFQLFGRDERGAAYTARQVLRAAHGAGKEDMLQAVSRAAHQVLPIQQLQAAAPIHTPQPVAPSRPVQGLRRGVWRDVQYKGDWMRRPIASNEIGWLVRLLVLLSDWINRAIGLDLPAREDGPAPQGYFQCAILRLRRAHFRINLRPLAEIQTLLWLPAAIFVLWVLKGLLWLIWAVITLPMEERSAHSSPHHESHDAHQHFTDHSHQGF